MKNSTVVGVLSLVMLSSCYQAASDVPASSSNMDGQNETYTQTNQDTDTQVVVDNGNNQGDMSSGQDEQTQTSTNDSQSTQTSQSTSTQTSIDTDTGQPTPVDSDTDVDTTPEPDVDGEIMPEPIANVFEIGYINITQVQDGNNYTFTAQPFDFPEDTELTYAWYMEGEDAQGEGALVSYEFDFTNQDTHEITLIVSDGINEQSIHAYVYDEDCASVFGAEIRIIEQNLQTVTFEGVGLSCSNPIEVLEYSWDFGDGMTVTTSEPRLSHRFEVGGEHIVEFSYELASTELAINLESEPAISSCSDYHNYGLKTASVLSEEQYNQAVLDLTGLNIQAQYDSNNVEFNNFVQWAKQIAIESSEQNFENILNCEYLFEDDCRNKYLSEVLPVFYRQSHDFINSNESLYDREIHFQLFNEYDFETALKLSLVSVFSSSQFIMNPILGEPKEVVLQNIEDNNMIAIDQAPTKGEVVHSVDFIEMLNYEQVSGKTINLYQSEYIEPFDLNDEGMYLMSLYIEGDFAYDSVTRLKNYPTIEWAVNNSVSDNLNREVEITWGDPKRLDIWVYFNGENNQIFVNHILGDNEHNDLLKIKIHKIEISSMAFTEYHQRAGGGYFDQFENGDYILSNWEIASLLSFNYLGSVPDQELVELALEYKLDDPIVIQEQIDRLQLTDQAISWAQTHNVENIQASDVSCALEQGE